MKPQLIMCFLTKIGIDQSVFVWPGFSGCIVDEAFSTKGTMSCLSEYSNHGDCSVAIYVNSIGKVEQKAMN